MQININVQNVKNESDARGEDDPGRREAEFEGVDGLR